MVINCEERYNEAMKHAEKTGDKSLQECLDRLKRCYEESGKFTIHLYKDFAPLSFYFVILTKEGERYMNGGVIYHGNPDQSFSVTMDKTIGWQVHT